MGAYAAYHRHPVNKAIHFVMVPAIVWSLMVALGYLTLVTVSNLEVTAAHAAAAVLLVWYLRMDFALGIASVVVFTMLLVLAMQTVALGVQAGLAAAGAVFVASWVFQFLGHGVWEKRRPALVDNLFQVFVAPLFLVAEAAFGFGFRQELRDLVEDEAQAHLPGGAATATA